MEIINDLIGDIIFDVENNITGRIANKVEGSRRTNGLEILMEYVYKSGGGNHIEIGTLFGGSAIAVALLKKHLEHPGLVFCIDPLAGFYNEGLIDSQSGVAVTPQTLFKNIQKFDVGDRIMVMQARSDPCPKFTDICFSTAYIDGDHEHGIPVRDWSCVNSHVTDYIIFDNHAETHRDVLKAGKLSINNKHWEKERDEDVTLVVRRINE